MGCKVCLKRFKSEKATELECPYDHTPIDVAQFSKLKKNLDVQRFIENYEDYLELILGKPLNADTYKEAVGLWNERVQERIKKDYDLNRAEATREHF